MTHPPRFATYATVVVVFATLAACSADSPTRPAPSRTAASPRASVAAPSTALPSGERLLGQAAVEPAYDDQTGNLTYLLTPIRSPFPVRSNSRAAAPLYLVEYPPGSTVGTLNCMGVPGNCPDHDEEVATVATNIMPSVYGTDPTLVPGHDHLVAVPASGGDFNIAWEVIVVLFTNTDAANTHLTTESAVEDAVQRGDAIEVDLGFAFLCAVVPATVYWRGTP